MNATDYQLAWYKHLPNGQLWEFDEDSDISKLLLGLSQELVRIDERVQQLLAESHPSMVDLLLEEWEADLGLPDDCTPLTETLAERKAAVNQKFKLYGSQSREFQIAMAAALGITITITEYRHRRFGDDFGQPWHGQAWNFVIQVNIAGAPSADLKDRLKCVLRKIVHSHKVLLYVEE